MYFMHRTSWTLTCPCPVESPAHWGRTVLMFFWCSYSGFTQPSPHWAFMRFSRPDKMIHLIDKTLWLSPSFAPLRVYSCHGFFSMASSSLLITTSVYFTHIQFCSIRAQRKLHILCPAPVSSSLFSLALHRTARLCACVVFFFARDD